jgi:hypothetical protein
MVRFAITAVAGLVLAVPSAAAGAPGVEALEDQAHTACLAGHPEQGVQLLAELYVRTHDPNYIYNQGRCFEQNGRPAEAISRFREYLRTGGDLTLAEQADAEGHIRECERQLAISAGPAPPRAIPPMEDRPTRRPLPRATAVLVGVGALALVAGAASGFGARALQADVEKQWSDSKNRWGNRLEALQWGAYVAGGLCLISGAVIWFAPAQSGQGGTVALRGTF